MYKVYSIDSTACYYGTSLVAADNVVEANSFINNFKEIDKENKLDSWGYENVTEHDVIEGLWSEQKGIIYYGIRYYG